MTRAEAASMVIAVAAIIAVLISSTSPVLRADVALPVCHEDQVLVGVGDFSSGRWTGYECGPSEDGYDPSR